MRKYKNIVLIYTLSTLLSLLLFFGTIYIQDPLKLFHKPWRYEQYLHPNMREQAAGIIRNWEFDSIILGTSMLENTSSIEASKELGGKFVNISMAGSSFYERKIVLEYTLKYKPIKKVLYSLDHLGSLIGEMPHYPSNEKKYATNNWDFLYDDNLFNDFKVYLNDKYLKCIFSFSNAKECIGRKVKPDRPNAWYQNIFHYYRFGGLEHWFKVKTNWQVIGTSKLILKGIKAIKAGIVYYDEDTHQHILDSQKYIQNTLESIVSKHPTTEFIFLIPPYSRLEYAIWAQYEKSTFDTYLSTLRYIVSIASKYPNMYIYGWGTENFLDDLANYQDLSHYEYKINSWQLKAIKHKKGLLTQDNIDQYIQTITQKALQYNVVQFEKQFEDFLKNN